MIGLIQRVNSANVQIDQQTYSSIERGILLLIGIEKTDTFAQADRLLHKVLNYRIFDDVNHRMNLSLQDIKGGLLIVPQFTLAADTHKGLRPSFSNAAAPEHGQQLYDYFVRLAKQQYRLIATGKFGADMQINLSNDGPVTFMLKS